EPAASDVLEAERLSVGLGAAILEPAYEALPDLVFDRRGDFAQSRACARGDTLGETAAALVADALRRQSAPPPAPPAGRPTTGHAATARVGGLPRRHEHRIVFLCGEVEVDGERPAIETGIEDRVVDDPPVVDAVVHLVAILLRPHEPIHQDSELVARREGEAA